MSNPGPLAGLFASLLSSANCDPRPGHGDIGGVYPGETTDRLSEAKIHRAMERVEEFEQRIDHLSLVCMAMWSLMKEKTSLTEDDLLKRMQEIDQTDGHLDGKARYHVYDCPQCGRSISVKLNKCLYCGYVPTDQQFAAFRTAPHESFDPKADPKEPATPEEAEWGNQG